MSTPVRNRLRHHLAFFAIGTLILFVFVTLPFTLMSAFKDVLGSPESEIYTIPSGAQPPESPRHSHVTVVISDLDEVQQLITLHVYIRRDFLWTADYKERLMLFSFFGAEGNDLMPTSVTVDFPTNEFCSTQTVQLPVRGQPLRYPFDVYTLRLGVLLQRVFADGRSEIMKTEEAQGYIFLRLSERLPRQQASRPIDLDPLHIEGPSINCRYMFADSIILKRPLYLKVLSVLLVLLVAAAASYAVFLRPLNELIVNSGALVLGVWGIRAILVAGSSSFVSAVDLALSMVILFLLLAISIRTLSFFKKESKLNLPWWEYRPSDKSDAKVMSEPGKEE